MKRQGENQRSEKNSGIRVQVLNIVMIAVAAALSLLLLYSSYRTTTSYGLMRDATEKYITCQKDAADMEAASDYLTEQVRAFAVTADREYVDKYFEETEETRRRDRALESMEQFLAGTDTYHYLSEALAYSSQLEQVEYYSMRLVVEAKGYDLASYPQALRDTVLSAEDAALTPEEKLTKAEQMLYDDVYRAYKDDIRQNVALCTDTLIKITRSEQVNSAEHLLELLRRQYVLIGALLIVVFVIVAMTTVLIVRPLRQSVFHIRNQQTLPLSGAFEMQFLAETYNTMFEANRKSQDQLSYEASHDSLTGLYNRGVFERMRESCDESAVAMILVDVDNFKGFNDAYGHNVGDAVLQKVAAVLQSSFRSEDVVCRVGGDEFAVIMVHAGTALKELVEKKLRAAADRLREPGDALPAVTLSVGVAFGDRENPTDDIYKDADTALYRVKERGRNGIAFY